MQCQYINHQAFDLSESSSHYLPPETVTEKLEIESAAALDFQTHFSGCMEMYHDSSTVGKYLAAHQGWFCRCAQPMKTQPLGDNGYILVIGKYGALGYEVEPKMAVVLEPPVDGCYYMHSVPLEDGDCLGYEVDYQASMRLNEVSLEQAAKGIQSIYKKQGISTLPTVITQVEWELHLTVSVHFPKFIHQLPKSLIQNTGDRVLTEIVRQVSPRLTLKVQKDFHDTYGLPLPPKEGRRFSRISPK